jgi:chromosome segregation ATPase
MTTTNDGGPNTTNAGPVLPELPRIPDPDYEDDRPGIGLYGVRTLGAYGCQCWNACDEQVAGPLREALSDCATAVGAGVSPDCSVEFLRKVPREVELVVAKLRERVAELERERDKLDSEAERYHMSAQDLAREVKSLNLYIDRIKQECDTDLIQELLQSNTNISKSYSEAQALISSLFSDKSALKRKVKELEFELDRLRAECEAKDAVIADSRRLAAEIGQALDGAGAATAPSLCDLIEPVRKLRMQNDMLSAECEALSDSLSECADDLEAEVKARELLAARAAREG